MLRFKTGKVHSFPVFVMNDSAFNLEYQNQQLDSKIVIALERIAEVIKSLQWSVAKELQLSPIQIQVLLFIEHHKGDLCTVSYLAKEFNVTKPTISDTVRVLYYKDLLDKIPHPTDSRSFSLQLSFKGKRLLDQLESYIKPLLQQVQNLGQNLKSDIWQGLTQLIHHFNKAGILQVQRMCFNCRYFEKGNNSNYCRLLNSPLLKEDIRLDCPEFEAQN